MEKFILFHDIQGNVIERLVIENIPAWVDWMLEDGTEQLLELQDASIIVKLAGLFANTGNPIIEDTTREHWDIMNTMLPGRFTN
jgi:hypothetical protein